MRETGKTEDRRGEIQEKKRDTGIEEGYRTGGIQERGERCGPRSFGTGSGPNCLAPVLIVRLRPYCSAPAPQRQLRETAKKLHL